MSKVRLSRVSKITQWSADPENRNLIVEDNDSIKRISLNNLGILSTPMIETTYANLISLRDNEELIPGQQYRITDYECTVANYENAQVESHPFDIIVVADSESTLNENARACLKDDDTYYHNTDDESLPKSRANLAAWELKYCLDNDTNRFDWADEENGKGVIYYLKDDYDNVCNYDFKQIQFKRYFYQRYWHIEDSEPTSDADRWLFTFTQIPYLFSTTVPPQTSFYDASVFSDDGILRPAAENGCYANNLGLSIRKISDVYHKLSLSNTVFINETDNISVYHCCSNTFGDNCYNNTFMGNCSYNTFDDNCHDILLGKGCNNNVFGNNCYGISLYGTNCIFGNNCYTIAVDNVGSSASYMGSTSSVFANGCHDITIGGGSHAVFGNECAHISMAQYDTVSFGNYCNHITISATASINTVFENNCFGINLNGAVYPTFESRCHNITLNNAGQYCVVLPNTSSDSSTNPTIIALPSDTQSYSYIGKDSGGNIKAWNPADLAEAQSVRQPVLTSTTKKTSAKKSTTVKIEENSAEAKSE